ncbi:MAG: hypothetical protein KAI94_16060, partial [Anaerolineales bacterium]|nr:hypothetical protein [Anaerolineales bacterium]
MDIASQVIHNQAPLSRRGFLKITATSALSLVFGKMIDLPSQVVEDQCRVIDASIKMYNIPSFEGDVINTYWQDMVLPITEATIGDLEPEHNRVWYLIQKDGYIHSGSVQPVRTQLNPVVTDIPSNGILAEVT